MSCSYLKLSGCEKKLNEHHTVNVNNKVSQSNTFKSIKVLILENTTLFLNVFSLPTKSLKIPPPKTSITKENRNVSIASII